MPAAAASTVTVVELSLPGAVAAGVVIVVVLTARSCTAAVAVVAAADVVVVRLLAAAAVASAGMVAYNFLPPMRSQWMLIPGGCAVLRCGIVPLCSRGWLRASCLTVKG